MIPSLYKNIRPYSIVCRAVWNGPYFLTMNYFKMFDLPHMLGLDLRVLEKKFHELSRRHHPDYHKTLSKDEQEEALKMSALLNNGYRTLKDPTMRAEYLLSSSGFNIDRSKVPQSLLMEVFEINEQLEEIREAKQKGNDLSSLIHHLKDFQVQVVDMRRVHDKELSKAFCDWDDLVGRGASDEDRNKQLHALSDIICRASYIRNLERDIEKEVTS